MKPDITQRTVFYITFMVCTTVFCIALLAVGCVTKFLDSDREIVIRHVIDLTPITKKQ